MTARTGSSVVLGLNEQELREGLEQEHAIAHSVA